MLKVFGIDERDLLLLPRGGGMKMLDATVFITSALDL
jgi:hypothetical protein